MTLQNVIEFYRNYRKMQNEYYARDRKYSEDTGKDTYYLTNDAKQMRYEMKKLAREFYIAFDAYEDENHLLWSEEKWITELGCTAEGMERARKLFLDYISKKDGIKVICDKSGIKCVELKTKNAIYTYAIHGYYGDGQYFAGVYSYTDKSPRDKMYEIGQIIKEMEA